MAKNSVFITYSAAEAKSARVRSIVLGLSYELESIDVSLGELMLVDQIGLHGDLIEVEFDPERCIGKSIYIVYVRYTTGGTFGSTEGNPHFVGAYVRFDTASDIEEQIRRGTWSGYAPWKGYFESLDSVEVVVKQLIDGRKKKE